MDGARAKVTDGDVCVTDMSYGTRVPLGGGVDLRSVGTGLALSNMHHRERDLTHPPATGGRRQVSRYMFMHVRTTSNVLFLETLKSGVRPYREPQRAARNLATDFRIIDAWSTYESVRALTNHIQSLSASQLLNNNCLTIQVEIIESLHSK